MKTKTTIIDGDIDLDAIIEWASKQKDGDYAVEIKKYFKNRSNQENAYYRVVVLKILCKELGYDPDDLHYALKEKFIDSWEDDNGLKQVKETKNMTTVVFEDYLSRIRMWASRDLGIFIPLPNEIIRDYE